MLSYMLEILEEECKCLPSRVVFHRMNIKTHNRMKRPPRSIHLKNWTVFQNLFNYFSPEFIQVGGFQDNRSFGLEIPNCDDWTPVHRWNFFHPCFQNKAYLFLALEFFQSLLFYNHQKRLGVKGLICRFDSMFFCEPFQS